MLENTGPEGQSIDGYPFVDTVEQRREIQVRRQFQRDKPETPNSQPRECFCIRSAGEHVRHGTGLGVGGEDRAVHRVQQFTVEAGFVRRKVDYLFPGDVRADDLVDLPLERREPTGQHAAVDHGLRRGGDDVGLVPGLEHGRIGGVT